MTALVLTVSLLALAMGLAAILWCRRMAQAVRVLDPKHRRATVNLRAATELAKQVYADGKRPSQMWLDSPEELEALQTELGARNQQNAAAGEHPPLSVPSEVRGMLDAEPELPSPSKADAPPAQFDPFERIAAPERIKRRYEPEPEE